MATGLIKKGKKRMSKQISVDVLIKRLRSYSKDVDTELLKKAYAFADQAHKGQQRKSGEPYLFHPIEVAVILTDLKLDLYSVVAGLLHDVVEDTDFTTENLRKTFGEEVAFLVEGVTKIGKIVFKSTQEKQAENFRKMIISMSSDIRVLLIKLADRLHNMRTLDALNEEKQERIAKETLEIYAPLSNRLGIGWIKSELEDLCLKALKPEIYNNLVKNLKAGSGGRKRYIKSIVAMVQKTLKENKFKCEIHGRSKHFFGIYRKMERQGIPFEEVYDLMGVRILTDSKMDCYAVLGLIHSLWRPLPGRFKDYIAIPKSNLYQSLHTTVIGPEGKHVEFQIRSKEMHQIAEEGIASHWVYKEGGTIHAKDERIFAWLRQLLELQRDLPDTRQFMTSVKNDLFTNVVFVFSPKGDLTELVKGATPIDFAYAVHTEIGERCVGAKINGMIAPLRQPLRNGDTLEILTSPTQRPNKDWLKFVKTSKARAKIKHFIGLEERAQSLEFGRKILERECRKEKLSPSETLKSKELLLGVKDQGITTIGDLLIAIGYGRVSAQQVLRQILPKSQIKEGLTEKIIRKTGLGQNDVKVSGMGDILIHLSKCCSPVPGEEIIGFITRGRGISIHAADCPNLDELDANKERLVTVDWDKKNKRTHATVISVRTLDRPGLLAAVTSAISEAGANISHAEIKTTDDQKGNFLINVDISNLKHLVKVLKKVESLDGVLQARRLRKT